MSDLYQFGEFMLDPRRRTLSRAGSSVSLTPKAYDVLLFLVQNANRLITKEELLQAVWGDAFVEEGNLTQYISHLRKALSENAEDTRLIVTVARKGYQFTAEVTVAEMEETAKQTPLPGAPAGTSNADARYAELPAGEKAADSTPFRFHPREWFTAVALFVLIVAAFWSYSSYRQRVTLSATDTIVLADITNETSDSVFDDALNPALRYGLDQTPYLDILGTDKVLGTLAQLNLPPTTKLTPDVARQVCLRTNSKLVISQSIGDAGNGYRFEMRALDCGSGAILAREHAEIGERGKVIHELGVTASRLRAKLGEPADSVDRFNQPLETALSSSLEALQASAQGQKLSQAGDAAGAVKLYQRAVDLDPNLALTHERMGAAYLFLGNIELSSASYTRAYQLRDRLTERAGLNIEAAYYGRVTGDWQKEYASVKRLLNIFPRDVLAHANLRAAYVYLGQPDRAADEAAETARLHPNPYYFGSAIQSIRFASRFNEAKSWLAQADALKLDNSLIRRERLIVSFATGDGDNVEKILQAEEQGKYREAFLHEHSLIEIQQGRFRSAERLRQQALEGTSLANNADWWVVLSALENAEVGREAEARRYESEAARRKLDRNNWIALALALARSGRTEEAGKLADQISAERPEDTQVQYYFVPTIRAAIKMQRHDPASAIDLLRGSIKYDLAFTGSFESLYPAYIRGLAYLQLGDGRSAAAQFQKLIDNPGFTVRHVIGPLAWLQLGRAQKLARDEATSRKSYETFLNLWKSADSDIPIYQQAKAEYAKLQK
jgi:DNA-binding winged helix-turn-helix (wHTH) protein/Flp pilus assembly protein TadD